MIDYSTIYYTCTLYSERRLISNYYSNGNNTTVRETYNALFTQYGTNTVSCIINTSTKTVEL